MAATPDGTEQLYQGWLDWARTTLGRDPGRAAAAAHAAVDAVQRGEGFNQAAAAATSAWNATPASAPDASSGASRNIGFARLWAWMAGCALLLLVVAVIASEASAVSELGGYAWPCSNTQPLNRTVCVTDSPTSMQFAFGFISLPEYSLAGFGLSDGQIVKGEPVHFWVLGHRVIAFGAGGLIYSTPEYGLLSTVGSALSPIGGIGLWVVTLLLVFSAALYSLEGARRAAITSYVAGVAAVGAIAIAPPWAANATFGWVALLILLVSIPTGLFGGVAGFRRKSGGFNGGALAGIVLSLTVLFLVARELA